MNQFHSGANAAPAKAGARPVAAGGDDQTYDQRRDNHGGGGRPLCRDQARERDTRDAKVSGGAMNLDELTERLNDASRGVSRYDQPTDSADNYGYRPSGHAPGKADRRISNESSNRDSSDSDLDEKSDEADSIAG